MATSILFNFTQRPPRQFGDTIADTPPPGPLITMKDFQVLGTVPPVKEFYYSSLLWPFDATLYYILTFSIIWLITSSLVKNYMVNVTLNNLTTSFNNNLITEDASSLVGRDRGTLWIIMILVGFGLVVLALVWMALYIVYKRRKSEMEKRSGGSSSD